MSSPSKPFSDSYDWRISDKQRSMIQDKIVKLSKKEASLLIKIIQAIFDNRVSELQKSDQQKSKGDQT